MGEHTLLIVEEDVIDDPGLYQVAMLEHPPDSKQVEIIEDAMRQLVEEAESETGTRHRFVKESGSPELVQTNYEMHVDRGESIATDGGVKTDRVRVSNSRGIVYGPAVDAEGYVLTVAADERRLELELDEDAMYTLWTEVKGVPWPEPDHMGEKDRLVRQVLHAANGADEEMLRDTLRVLGGERP